MKLFRLWRHDSAGLEQAKRADAVADERLRESRIAGRWARSMLDRDGFAEALVHIMQGGAS